MVPFQRPGTPEEHGLSLAQCEAAAWAFGPDTSRYRGAGAIEVALAVAVGSPLPYWLYVLPGSRQLQDTVYEWVVRNRHRLPGDRPYCDQHPAECGPT
ncbi:MAG: DUF393 domain-containing protein [Chloroflexota bacterium]|nr:DUF393 domain-containing protein [Chloroflexota bacterium]